MLIIRQTSAIVYDIIGIGTREGIVLDKEFGEQIAYIVGQIRSAGYDPYAQLTGFLRTHDDRYITRQGNSRKLIQELDVNLIRQYLSQIKP